MSNEVHSSGLRRFRYLFAFLAVLVSGFVLGVLSDRVYVEITKRTPDARLMMPR